MSQVIAFVAVGLVGAIALAILTGRWRWAAETRDLRDRLRAARQPVASTRVAAHDLDALPPPVARYLRLALPTDAPMIATARLQHRGSFATDAAGERWRPFTSDQLVITRRPGFDWDGRIRMMPGVDVRVHDAYVGGVGILHASLLGLITLARPPQTAALAEGELMRFLAEAVWYPTALWPGQGVTWEAIGDMAARATLRDGDVSVQLDFRFGPDGLVAVVEAAARGRTVGTATVPTPWHGRFWDYQLRGGVRVPLEGEVAWILPEGPLPYWRGRVEEIEYQHEGT